METDDREGLVRAYLDTLLPEEWDTMSLYDRRNFLNGSEFGEQRRTGTVRRMFVCNFLITHTPIRISCSLVPYCPSDIDFSIILKWNYRPERAASASGGIPQR